MGDSRGLAGDLRMLSDLLLAGQLSAAEYEDCKRSLLEAQAKQVQVRAGPVSPRAPPPALAPVVPLRSLTPGGVSPPKRGACTLLLCAQLQGANVNLELNFDSSPSIEEVKAKANDAFYTELCALRGELQQPPPSRLQFAVLHVFSDAMGSWEPLAMDAQIADFGQLWGAVATEPADAAGNGVQALAAPSPAEIPPPRALRTTAAAPLGVGGALRTHAAVGGGLDRAESPRRMGVAAGGAAPLVVTSHGRAVPLRESPHEDARVITFLRDGDVASDLGSHGACRQVEVALVVDPAQRHCYPLPHPSAAAAAAPTAVPTRVAGYVDATFFRAEVPAAAAVAAPASHAVRIAVSVYVYGRVVPVEVVLESAALPWPLVKQAIEEGIVAAAQGRQPGIAPEAWVNAFTIKAVQRYSERDAAWLPVYGNEPLHDGASVFVQLTTPAGKMPMLGDFVVLAVGHAPELLHTGCLRGGEIGVVSRRPDAAGEVGETPVVVCGPRGDEYVYYCDDIMVVRRAEDPLRDLAAAAACSAQVPLAPAPLPCREVLLTPHQRAAVPPLPLMPHEALHLHAALQSPRAAVPVAMPTVLPPVVNPFPKDTDPVFSTGRAEEKQEKKQEGSDGSGLQGEIDRLTAAKRAAVEKEDYAEAQRLKDRLDQCVRQRDVVLKPEVSHANVVSPTDFHPVPAHPHPTAAPYTLAERFKQGMTYVPAARNLNEVAEALHAQDPNALYKVVAEFQPALDRSKIEKNWRKIVGIYVEHARRAHGGLTGQRPASQPASEASRPPASPPSHADSSQREHINGQVPMPLPSQPQPESGAAPVYPSYTSLALPEDGGSVIRSADPSSPPPQPGVAGKLQHVINFIERPLSPRSLRDLEQASPRRHA